MVTIIAQPENGGKAMAEIKIPIIFDVEEIKEYLSSNDVVEVVRCKDCMYFKRGWCMNEDIRYGYVNGDDATTFEPDEDFWCKYGERK